MHTHRAPEVSHCLVVLDDFRDKHAVQHRELVRQLARLLAACPRRIWRYPRSVEHQRLCRAVQLLHRQIVGAEAEVEQAGVEPQRTRQVHDAQATHGLVAREAEVQDAGVVLEPA